MTKKDSINFLQHTKQIRRDQKGGRVNIMRRQDESDQITNYEEIIKQCLERMKKTQGALTEEFLEAQDQTRWGGF
ncbi:unnamed protein product [Paramecium octaurelia]|uniref:Uncharacterized protein n=1 Tax=Paramecium octaurelia TaxID=43137 RepID=A0A8S1TYU4_PAROT|nr:unnamed protein product [Paramecium octaurelia]CAD8158041.1 unnamed protein product [Paramecium octaurelia]